MRKRWTEWIRKVIVAQASAPAQNLKTCALAQARRPALLVYLAIIRFAHSIKSLRRHWRKGLYGLSALALGLIVCLAWPMDTSGYLAQEPSGELRDRLGRLLHVYLNRSEEWCFPRELDELSPWLAQATIAVEDQRFRRHWGVDPWAVLRAAAQNARERRLVSGASTLTMQVVKLSGRPTRSLSDKLSQALQALRLDWRVSKDAQLQAYLNRAPYGFNLRGCEAASRRFFGKPASELTLAEAALLAGLPRAPTALNPLKHPARAKIRRDYVLGRMRDEGYLTAKECARAQAESLGAAWRSFPSLSPHLAMRMKRQLADGGRMRTTLDRDVQAMVERRVAEQLLRYRYRDGIGNAAVIVVDPATASVLARVGSADFFNVPGGGQVDCTRAPRSPGSTLKPFTYALAMEDQLLYASEQLLDDSLDYGLYDPANFDGRYRGLVSASDALRTSLNVPAITTMQRIGSKRAYDLFQRMNFSTLTHSAEYYGLGLTLGNCEAKLEELAAAYTMLANLGEHRPLRNLADAPLPKSQRLLARGTCLNIYRMLEQPFPDEDGAQALQTVAAPTPVCWKTGTSTGYRDAWTFAFNQHYVVGVWLGNNDNAPSPSLIGAKSALPLASAIFRALPPKQTPAWPEFGDSLREVEVCAVSGLPASPWCPHTKTALAPREQYLHRVCDVHHPVRQKGKLDGVKIVERWPASAHGWDLAEIEIAAAPLISESGAPPSRVESFHILNPVHRAEFVLTGEKRGDRLPLRASRQEAETLQWYLDDRHLGTSQPGSSLFLKLQAGEHKLACMTPGGAVDVVHFTVLSPVSWGSDRSRN